MNMTTKQAQDLALSAYLAREMPAGSIQEHVGRIDAWEDQRAKASVETPPQQEPDYKDLYEKEKRRSEMWISKYEKDIVSLERAGSVEAQEHAPVTVGMLRAAEKSLQTWGMALRHTGSGLAEKVLTDMLAAHNKAQPKQEPTAADQTPKTLNAMDAAHDKAQPEQNPTLTWAEQRAIVAQSRSTTPAPKMFQRERP
jgi:hypothetical protein